MAYWYLEENYPIRIALMGGLALAVIEIALEKYFTKHVHKLSIFNFYLILALGSISLIGDDGIWFKLQPFFTGLFMGGFLFYKSYKGDGLIYDMAITMNQKTAPPKEILNSMELHLSVLLIVYGIFMAFVAFFLKTSQWLFFKTAGFYIVFFIFLIFEMIIMRRKLKKLIEMSHRKTNQQSN